MPMRAGLNLQSRAASMAIADWVAAGGQAFAWEKVEDPEKDQVALRAAQVKEIFRARCFECHGGSKTNAGIRTTAPAPIIAAARPA